MIDPDRRPKADPARRDRATRQIAAAPETLYGCWTDAAKLARWLPPDGAEAHIEALDPRPGGALRMVLRFAPGTPGKAGDAHDVVRARCVTLEPPHRLVLDIRFPSLDPAFDGTMRMAWRFDPAPGGCLASVEATQVPPGIEQDIHERALASSLANLDRLAQTL